MVSQQFCALTLEMVPGLCEAVVLPWRTSLALSKPNPPEEVSSHAPQAPGLEAEQTGPAGPVRPKSSPGVHSWEGGLCPLRSWSITQADTQLKKTKKMLWMWIFQLHLGQLPWKLLPHYCFSSLGCLLVQGQPILFSTIPILCSVLVPELAFLSILHILM